MYTVSCISVVFAWYHGLAIPFVPVLPFMINHADQVLTYRVHVRSVSLRAKLSCSELHELILDVRRYVELVGVREHPHPRYGVCCTTIGICSP